MYKSMETILHDEQVGSASVKIFEVKNDFRAMISGVSPGNYVRLSINGKLMMSDTSMEKRTNSDFCINAHGRVLIGGLGIGLIILAIQDNPSVEEIVVIENNTDVIEIMSKQLPLNEKVKIINADVFDFTTTKKFNTIYLDIWAYINEDIYQNEMKPLIKKYRKFLVSKEIDEKRYIDCWCKWEAKNGRRI